MESLTKKSLIWSSPAELTDLFRHKQNLERLILGAVAEAKPTWLSHIKVFLDGAPDPSDRRGKEQAMAVMASWFSDSGSEHFYRAVFQRKEIAQVLKAHLNTTGLWHHFENLTS